MFEWLGLGKRKQTKKQLWDSEFNIVDKGLDEQQVVDFVNDLVAQHKAVQEDSAASLQSLLETTATDAGQIAASIKMKAQTEAEAEAAQIINQARQEVEEIKRRAELAARKEAEDILSVANRKAEITEVEAKQRTLLFFLRAREEMEGEVKTEYKRAYSRLSASLEDIISVGQDIEAELKNKRAQLWESKTPALREYEAPLLNASGSAAPPLETSAPAEIEEEPETTGKKSRKKMRKEPSQPGEETVEEETERPVQIQEEPVQVQEEAVEQGIEQPVELQEEGTISELVEGITKGGKAQHIVEERLDREEIDSAQLERDSQTLYAGEVELVIAKPVDPKMMSKLYNYLQTAPELKVVHTSGSWDRGTTIRVVLDKPLTLISVISAKIPEVEATPELPGKEASVKGGEVVRRIKLALKEV